MYKVYIIEYLVSLSGSRDMELRDRPTKATNTIYEELAVNLARSKAEPERQNNTLIRLYNEVVGSHHAKMQSGQQCNPCMLANLESKVIPL